MKRLLGQGCVVLALGVISTVFAPACADNDQSIFVRMALAPAQNRQNGACIYTSDPTQPKLSQGRLDVAMRDTYEVELLVGNQLIQRGDGLATRAEANRVHINGAVVKVTDANGGVLKEFTSVASGFVEPQQNNLPSYGPVGLTALDAATTAGLGVPRGQAKLVIANIKAFGQTLGGVDVESGEFQFPIQVCNGCLVTFTGADDPAVVGADCNLPLAAEGTTGPCDPGQDEYTPCQYCSVFFPAGSPRRIACETPP